MAIPMNKKSSLSRVCHLRGKHAAALQDLAFDANSAVPPFVLKFVDKRPTGAFDYILAFDPTPKGIYVQSIIRWLLAGTIRFEDGRQVRKTLERFHAAKHRLELEARDIGHYGSPGEINRILVADEDLIIRDMPPEVEAGTELVDQGNGWVLLRVNEVIAAQWWADSTSWCTRHGHHARRYLERDALYILASKRWKYQIHVPTGQFMNEHDVQVWDLPDVPLEALFSVHRFVAGGEVPGATFSLAELSDRVKDIIDRRQGKKTVERPKVSPSFGLSWRDTDGHREVTTQSSEHDKRLIVRDGERGEQLLSSKVLYDPVGYPTWSVKLFAEFLKSGALRVSKGTLGDNVYPIQGVNELNSMRSCFLKNVDTGRVVVRDGRHFAIWVGRQEKRFSSLIVIDIDTDGHERVFSIKSGADFKKVPTHVQEAVCCFNEDVLDVEVLLSLGGLVAGDRERWQRPEVRKKFMSAVLTGQGLESPCLHDAVKMVFEDSNSSTWASLHRLLCGVEIRKETILRRTPRVAPTKEDVLACRYLDLGGLLLAALPDEECTDEIVDALLDAGRQEVINVMPAHLFTSERLSRVTGEIGTAIMSPRIISLASFQLVWEDFRRFTNLSLYLRRWVEGKGLSVIGALARGRLPGQSDKEFQELQALNENWEQYLVHRFKYPVLTAHVLRSFEAVPPVGLPWPYALEELERRPWLIDDVLAAEGNGLGWSFVLKGKRPGAGEGDDDSTAERNAVARRIYEAKSGKAVRRFLAQRELQVRPGILDRALDALRIVIVLISRAGRNQIKE